MTAYTILWLDEELLKFVHSLKSARVTGSFARGTPRNDSDFDIRLTDKDLQKLKKWLKSEAIPWNSELPGHITVDGVELYSGFRRQRDIPSVVMINDLTFKTW